MKVDSSFLFQIKKRLSKKIKRPLGALEARIRERGLHTINKKLFADVASMATEAEFAEVYEAGEDESEPSLA